MAQLRIEIFEERAMVIFDVPSAYLNINTIEEKFILLKFEDEFVNIICEVNPEFIKDIQQEGKKKGLYIRLLISIIWMYQVSLTVVQYIQ